MEYMSFGPHLARCRSFFSADCARARSLLVYGDGDGRFLASLCRIRPGLRALAVDGSPAMLRRAARRLPSGHRARLLLADARAFEPARTPEAPFDAIATHFFLDCLGQSELTELVARVTRAAGPDALWVVSDFAIPPHGPMRLLSSAVVALLYRAFGLLTGLEARRLPDHAAALAGAGWQLQARRRRLGGMLASECWRLRG
jgi:ubiquinone/menaquinone biosynthesis C-methylase UbiE